DVSRCLVNIAELYRLLGAPERALPYARESYEENVAIGDRHGQGVGLGTLGTILRDAGELTEALNVLLQAIELIEQAGMRAEECEYLLQLAATLTKLAEPDRALTYYERALHLSREIGAAGYTAEALEGIAALRV